MLYMTVNDDDAEIDHSDEDYVASSQSESDDNNDAEEEELQTPIILVTGNTGTQWESSQWYSSSQILVSNVIEEMQVLFQTGCTYTRACIDGFQYCRPVISVDGTHLRGRYKSILLIASTWDANKHSFPLAFAIVDKELSES
ncbi:hypothetical protein M9H77_11636 [Catharanthus roseus]|uniref:Uncharacterized protein n=1 Tax=Catharanthus roseus TaxID=4058 RepID=A0ACC0BF49_CATRO|nr:hypothetical protein M9H77_11636 [Catharanthus roseus]